MIKIWGIAACAVLMAIGCQKPNPVVVEPSQDVVAAVDVTKLNPVDTAVSSIASTTAVDSLGVTPMDRTKYLGLVLLNSVKFDYGVGIQKEANVTIYVGDTKRPFAVGGKVIGYWGLDLGATLLRPLTINGVPITRYPYRLPVPGTNRDTTFGFYFFLDLTSEITPNTPYHWVIPSPATLAAVPDTIITPDDIQVLAPVAGSVLSRSKPLGLHWSPTLVDINIVVGIGWLKPLPFMNLHPRENTGSTVIPASLLEGLPPGRITLTFIIVHRKTPVAGAPVAVLVQAASVYNSHIELQ